MPKLVERPVFNGTVVVLEENAGILEVPDLGRLRFHPGYRNKIVTVHYEGMVILGDRLVNRQKRPKLNQELSITLKTRVTGMPLACKAWTYTPEWEEAQARMKAIRQIRLVQLPDSPGAEPRVLWLGDDRHDLKEQVRRLSLAFPCTGPDDFIGDNYGPSKTATGARYQIQILNDGDDTWYDRADLRAMKSLIPRDRWGIRMW